MEGRKRVEPSQKAKEALDRVETKRNSSPARRTGKGAWALAGAALALAVAAGIVMRGEDVHEGKKEPIGSPRKPVAGAPAGGAEILGKEALEAEIAKRRAPRAPSPEAAARVGKIASKGLPSGGVQVMDRPKTKSDSAGKKAEPSREELEKALREAAARMPQGNRIFLSDAPRKEADANNANRDASAPKEPPKRGVLYNPALFDESGRPRKAGG